MEKTKSIYSFTVFSKQDVDEAQESFIEGKPVTITQKVTKEIPSKFVIIRPKGRALYDKAELYRNIEVSVGLQAGLISAALLAKRFENDGGIFSEQEKDAYGDKFLGLYKIEEDLQRSLMKKRDERTPEEQQLLEELIKQKGILSRELQNFELRQQSLFSITAEANARTKTILWWILFLLHEEKNGVFTPVFKGDTFKEKEQAFDSLEELEIGSEDSTFFSKVLAIASNAVAIWFYDRTATEEQIKKQISVQLAIQSGGPVEDFVEEELSEARK
jgi:hypothetical protein